MKKALAFLLSLMLLAGCAGSLAEAQEPFEDTFEFSYLTQMWEPFSEKTNLIPYYEQALNVKMNVEWAPRDNYSTRVLTSLAGAMPDAIMLRDLSDVATLIDQGAIVPLTDLLEEYCPNFLKYVTEQDMAYLYNVSDQEIYYIPAITDIPNLKSWAIRQDWLDALGREVPATWEEWKDLLRAFRDNDMNGNGNTSDEIPYSGETWPFLNSFGINASTDDNLFCVDGQGNYTLIFEHENYRNYLEEMVGMYKEGLIDPELATRIEAEKRKVMNADLCGLAFTDAEQVQLGTDALRSAGNEKAVWKGIAPVAGPDGIQALYSRSKFAFYTVITVGAESKGKVIDILKFFNWMYSDEGIEMNNYGIPGYTYDVVDGKNEMYDNVRESFITYRGFGMNFQPISSLWTVDAYVQVLTSGTPYDALPETRKLFYDAFYLNDPYFVTAPPTLQTEAYVENANTLISEAAQLQAQCIAGLISTDDFFTKYEGLKASGLQDVIDQGTEAYSAIMNK